MKVKYFPIIIAVRCMSMLQTFPKDVDSFGAFLITATIILMQFFVLSSKFNSNYFLICVNVKESIDLCSF